MSRWKRTRRQNAGPSSRRSLLFADTSGIPCEEMPSQLDAIAESFVEQRVSGVMFHPVDFCTSAGKANALVVARFREAGIPVVLLDCDLAFDRMLQMIWFAAMHKVGVGGRSGAKGLSRGPSSFRLYLQELETARRRRRALRRGVFARGGRGFARAGGD